MIFKESQSNFNYNFNKNKNNMPKIIIKYLAKSILLLRLYYFFSKKLSK